MSVAYPPLYHIIKNAIDNNQYETISATPEPCSCGGEGCKYCNGTGRLYYYTAITKKEGIIFYYAQIGGELRFWLSPLGKPNLKAKGENEALKDPVGPFGDLRRLKR